MKKVLLSVLSVAITTGSLIAQNYYAIKKQGAPADYNLNQSAGVTQITTGSSTSLTSTLSKAYALPFAFTLYGQSYTHFKASTSGYITFDTTQTADMTGNIALPSASAPKAAIFAFWDNLILQNLVQSGNTYQSDIRTYTLGNAPNRSCLVSWRLAQGGVVGATNVTYFAIRLYEGTTNFDVIHDYGFGSFTATVGCQNADGTIGYQAPGSPSLNYGGNNGNYLNTAADIYPFVLGNQISNDARVTVVKIPNFTSVSEVNNVEYTLKNNGSTPLTSFRINFLATDGSVKSQTVTGVNVAGSGNIYKATHSEGLSFAAAGAKTIKVWADQLNGTTVDEDPSNDTLTVNTNVMPSSVPRKVLHEVFTSSTCPPCLPGNQVLENVIYQKNGFTVIKYQYSFPGTGDPYFTMENQTRGQYYGGINSVPRLLIDGQWNDNPNGYTTDIFNQFIKPSYVSLTATQTIDVAAKTFNLTTVVKPTGAIAGNYKLRIALMEKKTTKNIKSNGETQFHWVAKKMLPSADGVSVDLTNTSEQSFTNSYTFPGSYRLPASAVTNQGVYNGINLSSENSVEEFEDLMAVVYIQNETDKTVLQSEWSTYDWISATPEIKMADLGISIFPNPASKDFVIKTEKLINNSQVRVFGIDGRSVFNQSVNSLETTVDCSSLQNGVYFVEISANGKTAVQKLVIAK